MSNTIIFQEEWAVKLQDRLDKPQNWKEVLDVTMTNTKVINRPYHTDPAVQTGLTRGNAYTYQDFVETNDVLTISTYDNLPVFIDRADLAQSTFTSQMGLAALQAELINDRLETAMLAKHADWVNFDNTELGGGAGNITVSSSNVDDIIRAVVRKLQVADGFKLMQRNGVFIIWRPTDFELLTAFMQANGFAMADDALKDGGEIGVKYMGVYHYVSNAHASGHLFAGVRKVYALGILKSTFGQVVFVQEPTSGSGNISAIGIVSRVDYQFKAWNNTKLLLFDVLVS